jgi:hypothetical protein
MRHEKEIEIPGENPFDEELKGKIKALEAFQTERTAKEFYEVIQRIFKHYNLLPKRPWFRERLVFLTFDANEDEALTSEADKYGERVVSYVSTPGNKCEEERDIFVGAVPANRIPSLDERRKNGEISPLEEMPLSIGIGDKFKHLYYN